MAAIHQKRMQMQKEWAEKQEQLPWIGDITLEEINKHNTFQDNWVIINGDVYNVTSYLKVHPGGSNYFLGKDRDITEMFNGIHPHLDIQFLSKIKIGKLVSSQ